MPGVELVVTDGTEAVELKRSFDGCVHVTAQSPELAVYHSY